MKEKISAVIKDIELYTGNKLEQTEKLFFTDGATDAVVFCLDNRYLVKITDLNTVKTQVEFLNSNVDGAFQKLVCFSEELCYLCFEFVNGVRFNEVVLDSRDVVEQIARIVGRYRKYPHDGYGFLNEEHISWRAFLLDEIEYARRNIKEISTEKVMTALEIAGRDNPEQYLLHGDFGTHNFLIEDGKIRVIDPMPAVGDYLYDFYFALLSNVDIFLELGTDYVYSFFANRNLEYKKALAIVVLYVRMSRAALYDKDKLQFYIQLYEQI